MIIIKYITANRRCYKMLTLDKVLRGVDYREKVMLPFYQEEIEVRALSDSEFAEARRISGIIKVAHLIEKANTNKDDPSVNMGEIDSAVSLLHLELAKMGIVDPLIREHANELMGGSIQIIGEKIIGLSEAARNDILSFFGQAKEK
jgi:hypothetical protein